MKENESVGPEQSTPATAQAEVYEGLKSAGLSDVEAFRTAEAVREQAGHNIKETLEVHQGKMDTMVDGLETSLTAKIDGVDSKLDAVKTELKADTAQLSTELRAETAQLRSELNADTAQLSTELRAESAQLSTELKAEAAQLSTELKAEVAQRSTELKADTKQRSTELSSEMEAIRRELNFYRWGFIVGIGLVTLLIAIMSFLVASGLLPAFQRWLWQDSTPSQSVQAPVESDPPETEVPLESDPPEESPQ